MTCIIINNFYSRIFFFFHGMVKGFFFAHPLPRPSEVVPKRWEPLDFINCGYRFIPVITMNNTNIPNKTLENQWCQLLLLDSRVIRAEHYSLEHHHSLTKIKSLLLAFTALPNVRTAAGSDSSSFFLLFIMYFVPADVIFRHLIKMHLSLWSLDLGVLFFDTSTDAFLFYLGPLFPFWYFFARLWQSGLFVIF